MPGSAILAPFRKAGPPRRGTRRSTVLPIPSAPATPNTPSPADVATAYYTLLSWVSAGATKFDIYLDTVTPPVALAVPKYVGTSYVPTLLSSTTYYWQIVAFNDGGSASGPVWSFTTPAATAVLISLAGTLVTSHVRFDASAIRDALNAQANTASLLVATEAPLVGQAIAIGLGTLDADALLFGGEVQHVGSGYVGTPDATHWPVTLIDHTFAINKRRPFGTWVEVSATTIAQYLVATFAPGFTAMGIAESLPEVSITFDGLADFMTCMGQLATAISSTSGKGRTDVTYAKDVILANTPDQTVPDPIDVSHPPLNNPSSITFSTDLSQIRTRVYGKGHGETVPIDVLAGETILPIADAVMFNPDGGQAVAGIIPDGAQSQILTYASIQLGGGGTLVGPGAFPSVAPVADLQSGSGIENGSHDYTVTFVTAAGESLPGPSVTKVLTGTTAAPSVEPTPSVGAGAGVDNGPHNYKFTFVTASGETTPSPISNTVTATSVAAYDVPAPSSAPSAANNGNAANGTSSWAIGDSLYYVVTYLNAAGETTASAVSNTVVAIQAFGAYARHMDLSSIPVSTDPTVITKRLYRNVNGSWQGYNTLAAGTTTYDDAFTATAGSPPGANTAHVPASYQQTISLTDILVGDASVTSRKLYRRFNFTGTFKLVATIANNTQTTYSDTTLNASLGADAPSTNTTTANRVALSSVPTGAATVTSRKLYRTTAGGTQLKLLTTLADNTTTIYADSTADASLGANVPTSDASGLTQPSGQVNAGSTTLLTAGAGAFAVGGGWLTLSGGQFVRYAGISGNTLTGIPASGPGAITITVLYGSQVLSTPALVGVNHWNGVSLAMAKGSKVCIWVQRDDLAAQAALGALELDANGIATDGIREATITDERRGEDSLIAACDADLAIWSRPIVSTTYYTRDPQSKSGRTVPIDLTNGFFDNRFFDPAVFDGTAWGLVGDFVIQAVDITFTGPAAYPLYHVTASSVALTLTDLLRKVVSTV